MKTSDSIVNIAKALAAAQGVMKNPEANEKVKVKMTNGGEYEYSYATLPKCFDALREPFKSNGLQHSSFVGYNEKGQFGLTVRLTHESGEWYESYIQLNGTRASKDLAGDITFWKRYLTNGMAGIAGDDDIRTEDGDSGPPRGQQNNQRAAPQTSGQNRNSAPPQQNKPAGKPANAAPQGQGKPADKKEKPAVTEAAAAAAQAHQEAKAKKEEPTPFEKAEAPLLSGEKPPAAPRPRGVIVKEIMEIAAQLQMGTKTDPKDVLEGLETYSQAHFQKKLSDFKDQELEEKFLPLLKQELPHA